MRYYRGMCKSNVTSSGKFCDTCISINNVDAVTDKYSNNKEPHRAVAIHVSVPTYIW